MKVKKVNLKLTRLLTRLLLVINLLMVSSAGISPALPLFEGRAEGACSTGLGRCSVLVPDAGFSGMNNPARAGEQNMLTASAYTSRPFSVPDLLLGSLWVSSGWMNGGFGAGLSLFGNEVYREEKLSAAFCRRSKNFSCGASLALNRVVIEGLGRKSFGSLTLGLLYRTGTAQSVRLGGVIRDIVRFGDPIKEEVRPEGAASISLFTPSTGTLLILELRGSSRYPVAVSMGVEFRLWESLRIRMGTGRNPSLYSVGLGVKISFLSIDLGVEEHNVLGQTRSVSITFTPSSI